MNIATGIIKTRAAVRRGRVSGFPCITAARGLRELEKREVTLAEGRRTLVPYIGPIELRFDGRRCFTGEMVLGDEALLGAIPLEEMDLSFTESSS